MTNTHVQVGVFSCYFSFLLYALGLFYKVEELTLINQEEKSQILSWLNIHLNFFGRFLLNVFPVNFLNKILYKEHVGH